MKSAQTFLRVMVFIGGLIVLAAPRGALGFPSGCSSYALDGYNNCGNSGLNSCAEAYPIYSFVGNGQDVQGGFEECQNTGCIQILNPEPLYDPSYCCNANGGGCGSNSDCCSGLCSSSGQCVSCFANGNACSGGSQCCSGLCSSGQCVSCLPDGGVCANAGQCCGGFCINNACSSTRCNGECSPSCKSPRPYCCVNPDTNCGTCSSAECQ